MTKVEAAELVKLAAANFPYLEGKNLKPTALLWAEVLGDVSYESGRKAVLRALTTTNQFPTVLQVRDAYNKSLEWIPEG